MTKETERTILIPSGTTRTSEVAARALMKAGFEVVLGIPTGFYGAPRLIRLGLCRGIHHPEPCENQDEFQRWLVEWVEVHSEALVLPILEEVLFAVNEIREKCASPRSFICPPDASLHYALSKYRSIEAAIKANLSVPKTLFIREPDSERVNVPVKWREFPAILKWDNAHCDGRYVKGSNKVVWSLEEVEDCVAELSHRRCGVLLQSLVPGQGYGCFRLRDQGETVLSFAHRRLHEVPWTGGVSAMCEPASVESIETDTSALLEGIDYRGVAMVEFRGNEQSGFYFMEINGRLWGSLGLAEGNHAPFPVTMVRRHLGLPHTDDKERMHRRTAWHDPMLQKLYVKSLWSTPQATMGLQAPKWRGLYATIRAFLSPLVKSDWWVHSEMKESLKMYLRPIVSEWRELVSKRQSRLKSRNEDALWRCAEERTKDFMDRVNPELNKFVFLCYGNICRSPFAEVKWNEICISRGWPLSSSAGFHKKVERSTPKRFQDVALGLGVNLSQHLSKSTSKIDLETADAIFVMDKRNLTSMQTSFPNLMDKVMLLGGLSGQEDSVIPDPYGEEIGAGGRAYRRIMQELKSLESTIINAS